VSQCLSDVNGVNSSLVNQLPCYFISHLVTGNEILKSVLEIAIVRSVIGLSLEWATQMRVLRSNVTSRVLNCSVGFGFLTYIDT
jgi:hypothetical protein